MSDQKKPGPMTTTALALLTPEAVERHVLDTFVLWRSLFRVPTPPRLEAIRKEGGVWIAWRDTATTDAVGAFLIVDTASWRVVGTMKTNYSQLLPSCAFELGHTYGLVPLAQC